MIQFILKNKCFQNYFSIKKKAFLLILLSWSLPNFAQNFGGGIQTNFGIPVNSIKEKFGDTVFPELGFIFYYPLINSPLDLGINIGYGMYGTQLEKRRDLFPGNNDEYRIRRNNNFFTLMGMIRYNIESKAKLTPFIEVRLGTNYFYTRYKIREKWDEIPIEEGRDLSHWVMAYSIGGGLKIPFKNKEMGHWEFKTLYQESTPTMFLRKQDTQFNPDKGKGEFEYNIQRSTLHFFQPGIGVIFYFKY